MSVRAVNWAIGAHKIKATEQVVLVVLAHHYSEVYHAAWPAQVTIAKATKLSRASVNVALNKLEEKGLIHRSTKEGESTRYTFPPLATYLSSLAGEPVQIDGVTCPADGLNSNKKQKPQEAKGKAASVPDAGAQGEPNMKLGKGLKVSDVVHASKAEFAALTDDDILAVKKVNGALTGEGLKHCWRKAHGRYVAGYLPALRVKEVGQLVQAYKRVGDVLPQLILLALRDWARFTAHAKDEGAFDRPVKPTIGHFVRYVDSAVSLAYKLEQQAAAPAIKTLKELQAEKAAKKAQLGVQSIAKPSTPAPSTKLSVADIEEACGEA